MGWRLLLYITAGIYKTGERGDPNETPHRHISRRVPSGQKIWLKEIRLSISFADLPVDAGAAAAFALSECGSAERPDAASSSLFFLVRRPVISCLRINTGAANARVFASSALLKRVLRASDGRGDYLTVERCSLYSAFSLPFL